jgi:hypothetical protein
MKTNAMKVVAVAMTAGALAAYAVSVRAEDTRGEIRALKAKLRMLEEKLDQQEKQVRGIVKFPKMPPTADVPIVCKDAPCPPLPPPVFVSFTNGLKVESWDGAFSFRIGGRILVDGGVSSHPFSLLPDSQREILSGPSSHRIARPDMPTNWVFVRPGCKSKARRSAIGTTSFSMTL